MYSQNSEEEYVLNYFGDYVGTFLDIGCNDCEKFSNTRALALKGWKGVLIDPVPEVIEKCRNLYKGQKKIYIYEWAITNKFPNEENQPFNKSGALCSASDTGLVSTFHNEEMDRFKRTVEYTPIEVITYKWRTAYNRLKIKTFDFVSIDVEGDEMNILPDMDFDEMQTKCICLEWNSKPELKSQFEKYLYGFKLIYTSAENLIYAK